ncbi:hypothetical protein [Aureivirga sp. CE67]|uniref:hypothetical protein n=1 Tax=Aureivirga sp. CE67 TaxID=1788983 RepID=UPI0018CA5809|nr:hypothetical protein [Aureivirga sp. CE67]
MKNWFRYRDGFVNIDSENFYLTNTGNWSEIKDINEKTKEVKVNPKMQYLWYILSLFLEVILGIVSSRVGNDFYSKIITVLIVFTIGLILYNLMRREFGKIYKVPLDKLKKVEIDKRNLRIEFLNGDDKEDSELIKGIDKKGIEIIENLKVTLHNKVLV